MKKQSVVVNDKALPVVCFCLQDDNNVDNMELCMSVQGLQRSLIGSDQRTRDMPVTLGDISRKRANSGISSLSQNLVLLSFVPCDDHKPACSIKL